jgi:hypothetical protein
MATAAEKKAAASAKEVEVATEVTAEVKTAKVATVATKEKLVKFMPIVSGTSTIAQKIYKYKAEVVIEVPEVVASILTIAKKGHKK